MVQSMTGYGSANTEFDDKKFHVEIRTLNSRNLDMRVKSPPEFHEKEMEIRRILSPYITRGKADVNLSVDSPQGEETYVLNEQLFQRYYEQLSGLKRELDINGGDIIQSILQIPNVIQPEESSVSEEEWKQIEKALEEAAERLVAYRTREGSEIEDDLRGCATRIIELLSRVKDHEQERIDIVRERIRKNLDSILQDKDNIDEGRFEQEIVYYLEKLDINEEKVRLRTHCDHFLDVLKTDRKAKGRKLNFISQEMGREINTLGAKANSSAIQQLVIQMKDELEKIKEQVANIV